MRVNRVCVVTLQITRLALSNHRIYGAKKIKVIDKIYINGEFVKPDGTESMNIINPSTKEVVGQVILGENYWHSKE